MEVVGFFISPNIGICCAKQPGTHIGWWRLTIRPILQTLLQFRVKWIHSAPFM